MTTPSSDKGYEPEESSVELCTYRRGDTATNTRNKELKVGKQTKPGGYRRQEVTVGSIQERVHTVVIPDCPAPPRMNCEKALRTNFFHQMA